MKKDKIKRKGERGTAKARAFYNSFIETFSNLLPELFRILRGLSFFTFINIIPYLWRIYLLLYCIFKLWNEIFVLVFTVDKQATATNTTWSYMKCLVTIAYSMYLCRALIYVCIIVYVLCSYTHISILYICTHIHATRVLTYIRIFYYVYFQNSSRE